jgi:hypothetical protein
LNIYTVFDWLYWVTFIFSFLVIDWLKPCFQLVHLNLASDRSKPCLQLVDWNLASYLFIVRYDKTWTFISALCPLKQCWDYYATLEWYSNCYHAILSGHPISEFSLPTKRYSDSCYLLTVNFTLCLSLFFILHNFTVIKNISFAKKYCFKSVQKLNLTEDFVLTVSNSSSDIFEVKFYMDKVLWKPRILTRSLNIWILKWTLCYKSE